MSERWERVRTIISRSGSPDGSRTGAGRGDDRGRMDILYAVTAALATASTQQRATNEILSGICGGLGWQLGQFWRVDRQARVLRCVASWYQKRAELETFAAKSADFTFASGLGLPGRIWSSGRPEWLADVVVDSNFPRAPFALDANLHGAFGFPVSVEGEILGVMEFFSGEIREPDEELLEMSAVIGGQIGHYLKRLEAEEAIRVIDARKSSILETALDSIIVIDHRGTILEFNPAAERTFGLARDDAVGRPMAEVIVPPSLREAHRHGFVQYIKTGQAKILGRRIEMMGLRADGIEFPVELAVTRVEGPGPPLFTGYLRDISDRKRLEAQLAHQAYHDGLTGLQNRAVFMTHVEHALAQAGRRGRSIAVLFADLDDFKRVNDTLGRRWGPAPRGGRRPAIDLDPGRRQRCSLWGR